MRLLFRLLSPKTARAVLDWMMAAWVFVTVFVGDVNLDRFQRWLKRTIGAAYFWLDCRRGDVISAASQPPPLVIRAFGAHGHFWTLAAQQSRLLDHLVGTAEQRDRKGKTNSAGCCPYAASG
jgi:hypothetical protein